MKLQEWVVIGWLLLCYIFWVVWERTIGRRTYVSYYDWPNRSLAEYEAEVERLDRELGAKYRD